VSLSLPLSSEEEVELICLVQSSLIGNNAEVPSEKTGRGGRWRHSCILIIIIIDKLPTDSQTEDRSLQGRGVVTVGRDVVMWLG